VIKGSSLPVLRIVVRDGDAPAVRADLADTIDDARPLLAEAIAVLDLRERAAGNVGARDVVDAVRDAGVRLAAVLIGAPGDRGSLADLDLPVIEAPLPARDAARPGATVQPDTAPSTDAGPDAKTVESTLERCGERGAGPTFATAGEPVEGPGAQAAPAIAPPPSTDADSRAPAYLTRPLRSGQRFYAQGRDVVVAAPTSRGSELIADGSIYAFSTLRGRVLAGASGNASACIVADRLDAELVAVAGVYRTFEPDDLQALGSGPVSVTLSLDPDGSERLAVAPLEPSSLQRR